MAFRILYNDEIDTDLVALYTYINDFTKALGIDGVVIDPSKVRSILLGMRLDFPHVDGLEKASSFKKIANFLAFFIGDRPIRDPFSESAIGKDLAQLKNHQNAIVGLHLAIDYLDGAVIQRENGDTITLKNRIQLSRHSYIDIIDAIGGATAVTHLKILAVFLEQLAYKSNPECQYDLVDF